MRARRIGHPREQLRARGETIGSTGRRGSRPFSLFDAARKGEQRVTRWGPARGVHAPTRACGRSYARCELTRAHGLDGRHAPDEAVEHTHGLVRRVRQAEFVVAEHGCNRWKVVLVDSIRIAVMACVIAVVIVIVVVARIMLIMFMGHVGTLQAGWVGWGWGRSVVSDRLRGRRVVRSGEV